MSSLLNKSAVRGAILERCERENARCRRVDAAVYEQLEIVLRAHIGKLVAQNKTQKTMKPVVTLGDTPVRRTRQVSRGLVAVATGKRTGS